MPTGHYLRKPLSERLNAQILETPTCWLWTGVLMHKGYGHIGVNGKTRRVHRLAWELANGRPVPAGYLVLHKCDTRNCVRPSHLFIGDEQDNMTDMWRKGRARPGGITQEAA